MQILQQMTMVSTAYQTANDASDEAITNLLIAGFSGQLKGWWDNYLLSEEKNVILTSVKTEPVTPFQNHIQFIKNYIYTPKVQVSDKFKN